MKASIGIAFLAVVTALAAGCADDQIVGRERNNEPPQVWLSSAPPEGSVSGYTLHLYWGGWDPDGEISHYEWTVTNNEGGVFDPADTTGAARLYGSVGMRVRRSFDVYEIRLRGG